MASHPTGYDSFDRYMTAVRRYLETRNMATRKHAALIVDANQPTIGRMWREGAPVSTAVAHLALSESATNPLSDGARLALILGGIVVIGGIFYAVNSSAAAAPAPPQNFLAVITDKPTITQYQTIAANAIASGYFAGLTTANYAVSDVDGNAANPKWVAVLSYLQTAANANRPWTNPPAGFPAALRTDGVLDYATAVVLNNA